MLCHSRMLTCIQVTHCKSNVPVLLMCNEFCWLITQSENCIKLIDCCTRAAHCTVCAKAGHVIWLAVHRRLWLVSWRTAVSSSARCCNSLSLPSLPLTSGWQLYGTDSSVSGIVLNGRPCMLTVVCLVSACMYFVLWLFIFYSVLVCFAALMYLCQCVCVLAQIAMIDAVCMLCHCNAFVSAPVVVWWLIPVIFKKCLET